MILVTVGTQLPFPRLIQAVADSADPTRDRIIAQIGPDPESYARIETHAMMPPARMNALAREARVIVAHAGIGSVLMAQTCGTPLVIMPRRHTLGEHRNDHQMATAAALSDRAGIYCVNDAADLARVLVRDDLEAPSLASGGAYEDLLTFVSGWIASDSLDAAGISGTQPTDKPDPK